MDEIEDEEEWVSLKSEINHFYRPEEMVIVDKKAESLLKAIKKSKSFEKCQKDIEKVMSSWV